MGVGHVLDGCLGMGRPRYVWLLDGDLVKLWILSVELGDKVLVAGVAG